MIPTKITGQLLMVGTRVKIQIDFCVIRYLTSSGKGSVFDMHLPFSIWPQPRQGRKIPQELYLNPMSYNNCFFKFNIQTHPIMESFFPLALAWIISILPLNKFICSQEFNHVDGVDPREFIFHVAWGNRIFSIKLWHLVPS